MSGGFFFPPPPPPPPKATASWGQDNTISDVTSHGAHRMRGGVNSHGNEGRVNGYGTPQRSSNASYGAQLPEQAQRDWNAPNRTSVATSHVPPILASLPPGAYVNPSFHPQRGNFDSRSRKQGPQNENVRQSQHATDFPSRTVAGHKRKLEVLRGPPQDRTRPIRQVPPATPTYGSSTQPISYKNSGGHASLTPIALSGNAFGLVPVERDTLDDLSEVSEDEKELDEEALFAELGDKLTFEHNGSVMVLSTAADIAVWQEERRRNWPTSARMEAKNAEKRVIGAERRRLLSAATAILNDPMAGMNERKVRHQKMADVRTEQPTDTSLTAEPETELQSMRRHLKEQTEKLESIRQRVVTSQARLDEHKAKQAAEDERLAEQLAEPPPGNDDSSTAQHREDASGEVSETSSQSSVVSSDSDAEGPPEETSSKRSENVSTDSRPLCKYFTASGRCRDGDGCRFGHAQGVHGQQSVVKPSRTGPRSTPLSSNNHRKGIFQRLAEQEQDENDRLVLQVVKSLGRAGFFK